MQAAAAAPIERLPGEVVARVFFFVDPKTLMMTIPSVSGRFEQGVEVLGLCARLPMGRGSGGRWARRWRKYSFWPWAERGATAMWRGGRCSVATRRFARRGGTSARSSWHRSGLTLAGRAQKDLGDHNLGHENPMPRPTR